MTQWNETTYTVFFICFALCVLILFLFLYISYFFHCCCCCCHGSTVVQLECRNICRLVTVTVNRGGGDEGRAGDLCTWNRFQWIHEQEKHWCALCTSLKKAPKNNHILLINFLNAKKIYCKWWNESSPVIGQKSYVYKVSIWYVYHSIKEYISPFFHRDSLSREWTVLDSLGR